MPSLLFAAIASGAAMKFELDPLPYAKDALQPFMSEELSIVTMRSITRRIWRR
jgi:hypothetical protein